MTKAQMRFNVLRHHLSKVGLALLDSISVLYGEKKAERICRRRGYKKVVLADLERATWRAYKLAHKTKGDKAS